MWQEILRAILFGILEGVTEWLPVSSTGHLILLRDVLTFSMRPAVFELFEVVIQLGAILAVAVLFWHKLGPFSRKKTADERRATRALWGKVFVAVLPSAVLGLLLDDWLDAHFYRARVVAAMLILYGVAFLIIERRARTPYLLDTESIAPRTAFGIGLFQLLALIPGTSRSGATILGGVLLGLSRPVAAEFSFFLGIPTMAGAGILKTVKFFAEGNLLARDELLLIAVGTLTAFAVSLAVIRFLMDFVRRHSFGAFGAYRIALGGAVLLTYFI
ncbi:MAG: undecaprenyl-diphosphate phosphatase [Clostridia bacterium]|nr:undecaprenyl-diphosphate phosphatase [Clostridia bacterium]